MDDLTRVPSTDPTEIFRYRDGIYAPELFAAAMIGLDFFTWLGKSPASAETICSSFDLAPRPVDVMLALFAAMGFVEKKGGVFHLTQIARDFLVSDSPWFIAPYFAHFRERPIYKGLLETLRTDKPAGWAGQKDRKGWAQEMEGNDFAVLFTGSMDARGMYVGPLLARSLDLKGHRRLLDIGGGSAIYSCCVAAAHPHIEAAVFEKPPVDRVTQQSIAKRGFSGRVSVVSGDMFRDPLPTGYDVHLWSNVLHDWAEAEVKRLVEKSYAALAPGGMIVILDRHLNREKNGPLPVAAHSVFLMAETEGKYYSAGEIGEFTGVAGFTGMQYTETAADYSIITARKPAR